MTIPFEDPAKTALIKRCRVAIENAAYTPLDEPEHLPIPEEVDLQGVVRGDLQSVDGSGTRYVYVVRPGRLEHVPVWVLNWARACHMMDNVEFYVVVVEHSEGLPAECERGGVGLLIIDDADSFQLLHSFRASLPPELNEALEKRARGLRRELESKSELLQQEIKSRFSRVGTLTSDFSDKLATEYTKDLENEYQKESLWAEGVASLIDQAITDRTQGLLDQAESMLHAGPPGSAENEEDWAAS